MAKLTVRAASDLSDRNTPHARCGEDHHPQGRVETAGRHSVACDRRTADGRHRGTGACRAPRLARRHRVSIAKIQRVASAIHRRDHQRHTRVTPASSAAIDYGGQDPRWNFEKFRGRRTLTRQMKSWRRRMALPPSRRRHERLAVARAGRRHRSGPRATTAKPLAGARPRTIPLRKRLVVPNDRSCGTVQGARPRMRVDDSRADKTTRSAQSPTSTMRPGRGNGADGPSRIGAPPERAG